MNKTTLSRAAFLALLLAGSSVTALAADAPAPGTTQVTPTSTAPANAPAKPIGAAPANSKQSKVLDSALTKETRQTLQDAMNAFVADDSAHAK